MTPLPGREEPDRPLEGLGTFVWKLALASVVALAGVAIALMLWGGDRPGSSPAPQGGAPSDRAAEGSPRPRTGPAEQEPAVESAATPVGREIDRRLAAGELSEAQRKFAPCPGGDLRRVAWIDAQQRVRKLVQYRASGLVLEQWFDEGGRLREALVRTTAGGRGWTRRVALDEGGRASIVDAPPGIAPDEPPPELVRQDPGGAFFSGAGCGR